DPSPRADVSHEAHEEDDRRGDRAPLPRHARDAGEVARPVRRRRQALLPGEGHGLPRRDGGPWPLREAVPRLRDAGAEDRLRRQRIELLPEVPDRRQAPRRPRPLAAPAGRLAQDAGGAGGAQGRPDSSRAIKSRATSKKRKESREEEAWRRQSRRRPGGPPPGRSFRIPTSTRAGSK